MTSTDPFYDYCVNNEDRFLESMRVFSASVGRKMCMTDYRMLISMYMTSCAYRKLNFGSEGGQLTNEPSVGYDLLFNSARRRGTQRISMKIQCGAFQRPHVNNPKLYTKAPSLVLKNCLGATGGYVASEQFDNLLVINRATNKENECHRTVRFGMISAENLSSNGTLIIGDQIKCSIDNDQYDFLSKPIVIPENHFVPEDVLDQILSNGLHAIFICLMDAVGKEYN